MQMPSLPVPGHRNAEWEKAVASRGYCESMPDRSRPADESFNAWAAKRRLALVDGPCPVAFDPKHFNPKDTLDRSRFAFLVRYFRPRPAAKLQRDMAQAFGISSMYVIEALKAYWTRERIIQETRDRVQADPDILRLMGFSHHEIMDAMDGITRKDYLAGMAGGVRRMGAEAEEYGDYYVNFGMMKERYFEGEFILQVAGQPVSLVELGEDMGVDNVHTLRSILVEAKKRYDLNIQVSETHVMFGAPSQAAVDHLSDREKSHKHKLAEMESVLRDRQKTIKDLLDRYSAREAKIMNEIESLKEEGRMVYVKSKVVDAVQQRLEKK